MTDTVDPEALDGYTPPPYEPPATLDERLATVWRELTRTPGRAALATLDLCAVAAFLVSLRAITVTTADAAGPLRAHCGVTFYVAGASNHAVDAACRYAFASRMPTVVVLGLVVIGVTALLVRSIVRPAESGTARRLWGEVTRTPARAALATFDVAALIAVIVAAQPITVTTADAAGALRARCGVQFSILGAANSAVSDACGKAYGPRETTFFVLLAVLLIGGTVLTRMLRRATA
ncbi:MAG: hypothetical protein ACYDH6_20230 [Acidimicrobiales bacterium]